MKKVAIIGGGPTGLMAAQVLVDAGLAVHLYDAIPSVGRKFLLAGKGGLNLTHSEDADRFASRFGARRPQIERLLQGFGPEQLRAWAKGLGIDTFIGTSGRVFPTDMKAAPLLRAWLHRLRHPIEQQAEEGGVRFHMRHRWLGWAADGHTLRFETPQGEVEVTADAVVLALGGGSWARLGSNGAWVSLLAARGVHVAPLLPANCGFDVVSPARSDAANTVGWSQHFTSRFAGHPLKSVAIAFTASTGQAFKRRGEFVATQTGVEGSLIYAASSLLRDGINAQGHATLHLDLLPDHSPERVLAEASHPRGSRSLSSHLKSRLGLEGIKMALLHEILSKDDLNQPTQLAAAIKALPLHLVAARPLIEAISSAGGVPFEVLDDGLMLQALPGVFCAGEMLDWEAPTGGYLLTACFASGKAAGEGAVRYLQAPARV
jgi:uncharacterized flavoprotein (TIGR03862 family)